MWQNWLIMLSSHCGFTSKLVRHLLKVRHKGNHEQQITICKMRQSDSHAQFHHSVRSLTKQILKEVFYLFTKSLRGSIFCRCSFMIADLWLLLFVKFFCHQFTANNLAIRGASCLSSPLIYCCTGTTVYFIFVLLLLWILCICILDSHQLLLRLTLQMTI